LLHQFRHEAVQLASFGIRFCIAGVYLSFAQSRTMHFVDSGNNSCCVELSTAAAAAGHDFKVESLFSSARLISGLHLCVCMRTNFKGDTCQCKLSLPGGPGHRYHQGVEARFVEGDFS